LDGFEVAAVVRHIRTFAALLDACTSLGCLFPRRRATIYSVPQRRALVDRLKEKLTATLSELGIAHEELDSAYHDGVRVLMGARSPSGEFVPVADTGVLDWMGKLTSNRRLRFVASGFGLQLAWLPFRQGDGSPGMGAGQ
jgi:hypothetical protein